MGKSTSDRAINLLPQGSNALITHAKMLNVLKTDLTKNLPEPLNSHVDILNFRDGTLLLITESPAWATRIRFLEPQLISKLAQEKPFKINKIRVKIRPPCSITDKKNAETHPLCMSSTSARILEQTAASIEHPGLSSALQRLAANANKT